MGSAPGSSNGRMRDSESLRLGSNPSPGANPIASPKITPLLFVVLSSFFLCDHAQAVATEWKANPNGQVRLISADDRVPAQGTLLLGFHFKTAPGWYVYWKVPGDTGYPPSVNWSGSEGLKSPEILWPAPTKFVLPGNIVEYGYEGEIVYPVQARLDAHGQTVRVSTTSDVAV